MDLTAIDTILGRIDDRFEPDGLFLWKRHLVPGKKSVRLRLFIDRRADDPAAGVSHQDCIAVSRWLTETLDAELPELDYTLEVSSPGADRPLESIDDIRRFRGRRAKLTLVHDGVPVTWLGVLGAVAAAGDSFEFVPDRDASRRTASARRRSGASGDADEPVTLVFSEIQKAHLSIV